MNQNVNPNAFPNQMQVASYQPSAVNNQQNTFNQNVGFQQQNQMQNVRQNNFNVGANNQHAVTNVTAATAPVAVPSQNNTQNNAVDEIKKENQAINTKLSELEKTMTVLLDTVKGITVNNLSANNSFSNADSQNNTVYSLEQLLELAKILKDVTFSSFANASVDVRLANTLHLLGLSQAHGINPFLAFNAFYSFKPSTPPQMYTNTLAGICAKKGRWDYEVIDTQGFYSVTYKVYRFCDENVKNTDGTQVFFEGYYDSKQAISKGNCSLTNGFIQGRGATTWVTDWKGMIRKTALMNALRKAFPDLASGIGDEIIDEISSDVTEQEVKKRKRTKVTDLKVTTSENQLNDAVSTLQQQEKPNKALNLDIQSISLEQENTELEQLPF